MIFTEIATEHHYLNLGRKCACGSLEVHSLQSWARHLEAKVQTENALDVMERGNVPVRLAIELLENAESAVADATESDNPNALSFAAGFITGTVQRVILMLKGEGS